ncbi:TraB family protein [Spirochaeta thermophila DSM 6578]|uniref:TraB family protein n=1 Tax=Winmispira thermophila (strain ATCC 700085 / DSM 6578 / Z-1203) TaxID=869211 RepID=G0GC50_WINT7|nr:TraB/GumN family protein [Spirochaeta thermophila]AEJ60414.1 TraB family protein [Spirochaeta thermophila DSM 6578]
MSDVHTTDTVKRLVFAGREIILVGTAHVSKQSVEEVRGVIREEAPDGVCVEIDPQRLSALRQEERWSNLDVYRVLREGRGFMLLANLVLSSFQRRIGLETGVKPGEEMKAAVESAEELGIPYHTCDRDVQVTLRRAWARTSLWGRAKLLAALLASAFEDEKISAEEVERLKRTDALQAMMEELASYLPEVKEVLIDERDVYLARRIWESPGRKLVVVVGAGHLEGIVRHLERCAAGDEGVAFGDLETVPPSGRAGKVLGWLVPAVVLGLIAGGVVRHGWEGGLRMFLLWVGVNGGLAGLGTILAGGHPLTILAGVLSAPFTSMTPVVGVGLVTGLVEASLRRPRVGDLERLNEDIASWKGFFRNRVTRILLVFFFSSVGSVIGTFVGIPWLASFLGG